MSLELLYAQIFLQHAYGSIYCEFNIVIEDSAIMRWAVPLLLQAALCTW